MKRTPGPWEAEHRPHSDSTQCYAVVTDQSENVLFDTLNRGYKVSLVEQLDDDGKWYDSAGYADLEFVVRACECHDELLEALKDLVGTINFWHKSYPAVFGQNKVVDGQQANTYLRAKDAIAKAEGRT